MFRFNIFIKIIVVSKCILHKLNRTWVPEDLPIASGNIKIIAISTHF